MPKIQHRLSTNTYQKFFLHAPAQVGAGFTGPVYRGRNIRGGFRVMPVVQKVFNKAKNLGKSFLSEYGPSLGKVAMSQVPNIITGQFKPKEAMAKTATAVFEHTKKKFLKRKKPKPKTKKKRTTTKRKQKGGLYSGASAAKRNKMAVIQDVFTR